MEAVNVNMGDNAFVPDCEVIYLFTLVMLFSTSTEKFKCYINLVYFLPF
jgi:hypothetical protein